MLVFPPPQRLQIHSGFVDTPTRRLALDPQLDASPRFHAALSALGFETADRASPPPLSLSLEPSPSDQRSAKASPYAISVSTSRIRLAASDEAAAFHCLLSLRQLLDSHPDRLPCLELHDWPDLPQRGFMLDISRCKVPRLASLKQLIDTLAELKYNQLQLYTEHTFAYQGHQRVWQDASPLTAAEVQELDTYCYHRYIELVPNQNSFGHMERWLRHRDYHHLAESPDGFLHPLSGWKDHGSTLCPTEASADFVDALYAQLLPNFRSRTVNIGGDEPWELGQGRSRAEVAERGKTRVYLDHLLRLHQRVARHGKCMQFWGDIIINQPELARELPPDATALLWGYESDHPFPEQCAAMQAAGARFYLVPGTASWNSIGGRLTTATNNAFAACRNAKQFQAAGVLLTEWGDNGHHQSHLASLIPIILTACHAWSRPPDPDELRLIATNSRLPIHVSRSEYDHLIALGHIPDCFHAHLHNASWLNRILFTPPNRFDELRPLLSPKELHAARHQLAAFQSDRDLEIARQLLRFAADKGIALLEKRHPAALPNDLLDRFRHAWLERNRPGGLTESLHTLATPNP